MSTGFRIFLLMVFAFGAIWVYRFRSSELYEWVRPRNSKVAEQPPEASVVSPLNETLGPAPDISLMRLESRNPPPPLRAWEADPAEPEDGWLPPEEELAVADVAIEEGDGSVDGSGDAGGSDADGSGGSVEDSADADPGAGGAESDRVVQEGQERGGAVDQQGTPKEDPSKIVAYEELTYKVQDGESLWTIAAKMLGSGKKYSEIISLNKAVLGTGNVDRIPAGTVLKIRRVIRKEDLKVPPPQDDTSVERNSAAEPNGSRQQVRLHTVKRNENLRKIAQRYYSGDAEGWKAIFEANRKHLTSADNVVEGMVLRIPPAAKPPRPPER